MKRFEEFGAAHQGACVSSVHAFVVEGESTHRGVLLRILRGRKLTTPLKRRKQPQAQDDEASAEDSMEDELSAMSDTASGCSVDTDVDTEQGTDESQDEEDIEAPKGSPANAAHEGEEATDDIPDGPLERLKRPPLWSNNYFYILDNEGHSDVKVRMHAAWATPHHVGHYAMSKTLTPAHFGEARADPRRSLALLKAWVLWRGRQHGWAGQRVGRARQFDRDARELEGEVRALPGELLGNDAADAKLREWAPDVVGRILAA